MNYLKRIVVSLNQLVNTVLGGSVDETISARSYKLYIEQSVSWPYKLINGLFFWQNNHCRGAHAKELFRLRESLKQFELVRPDL